MSAYSFPAILINRYDGGDRFGKTKGHGYHYSPRHKG